jgi:hypothetical protein
VDLHAFEKTRNIGHNRREHNPPTQTHMRIERTYMHSRTTHTAQHTTRENTTYQHKHTCASRGPNCIREQDTQHSTTQPTNTNTHAYREDLTAFENKTHSTTHNTIHQLKHIGASRGIIMCITNISNETEYTYSSFLIR